MRRKNRQLKITIDIPDSYGTDEEFMEAVMERMDDQEGDEGRGWCIRVDNQNVPISKILMGDIEIEPEEETD